MKLLLRSIAWFVLIIFSPTWTYSQYGISFDGANDYVTFGSAAGLGATSFTIECWFKQTGTGISTTTGAGGVNAVPLIAKGRSEADGNTKDMNYFLGVNASNYLVADFEEGAGQPNIGMNHPLTGVAAVCNNRWNHAAATYDGTTFKIYLNGILDQSLNVGRLPQSASIQHASVASALNSTGVAAGFFKGSIDEVRIWNYARTSSEIASGMNVEIVSSTGLLGRWGMNEGTGTSLSNSGSAAPGTGILKNGPLWTTGTIFSSLGSNTALNFGGTNSYVSFGNQTQLGLSQFTLECWLMRTGTGSAASSGTGGVTAIPLITKGRGEEDGNNKDANYFFGIHASNGKLAADFEEGTGQANPGLNHPVYGNTAIPNNQWIHAAATYDGVTWKIYLNGNLENTLVVNRLPQSGSIQHAAIASALNSTGVAAGFFKGLMDEVRIWNYARSQSEIQTTMSQILPGPRNGMIARWALNEKCGSLARDSSGFSLNGTLAGSDYSWDNGALLSPGTPINQAPNQPVLISPSNASTGIPFNPNLSVSVSDPESNALSVAFYIRPCPPAPDSDFTIIPIPDTQYYTGQLNGGNNSMYKAQMQWILDHRISDHIVFVEGLGDCVQNGDNGGNDIEWKRADTCQRMIEDPVATASIHGIPYGLNVGNHDQSPGGDPAGTTNFFNQYFGSGRFTGRVYYGGHYGNNNDNNFQLFSTGSLQFIVINFEYAPAMSAAVLAWGDSLLNANANRRAIIGSHFILNSNNTFGPQGAAIYNMAKSHPNVFLMLCGHNTEEAQRTDTYQGNTITTLMSDYQARTNGGNGWMRIMRFSPATNTVSVKTFSPTLNQFETDANSQFSFSYTMQSAQSSFSLAGANLNVNSGTTTSILAGTLQANTCYQWYATSNDGSHSPVVSPTWSFQTGAVLERTKSPSIQKPDDEFLVTIFPNPSHNGKFYVKLSDLNSSFSFQVINLFGQRIFSAMNKVDSELFELDLSGFGSGVYLISFTNGKYRVNRKVVSE